MEFLPFNTMRLNRFLLVAAASCLAVLSCRFQPDSAREDGMGPDGEGRRLSVGANAVPPSFNEATVASITAPTSLAVSPDGRVFVCEKDGKVHVIKDGVHLPRPFLTLSVNTNGERGLLGIAFDPDFANTRHVFIYHTASSPVVHNRLTRFTASLSNPDTVIAGSGTVLLDLEELGANNHNGGAMAFGSDGKLYVAVGENAVPANSHTLANRLGKILRLNKDGSIPSDNPFYATAAGDNRAIWALGLRNPYSFAVQPGTGRMYINDVGAYDWEEINEGQAGADYGWPATEGATSNPAYKTPLHYYNNDGADCAITGAAFYNPASATFPADYLGDYFFGDYCGGWIRRIDPATKAITDFVTGAGGPVGIAVAPDGSLYYCAVTANVVRRVTYAGSQPPSFTMHPNGITVAEGTDASFSVSASGAATITYRWQRGGTDIPGATASQYTLVGAQLSDSGAVFRCIATNAQGSDTSDEAVLRVTLNRPPVASITGPDQDFLYRGGDSLAFSGTATDPEDGTLPGSAFTWRIDFHHDTHTHPLMPAVSGSSTGKAAIPSQGETSSNVWLRIHLTAKDKEGLVHQVYRDIHPRKSAVTLATIPAGLQLILDGSPVASPHGFTGVAGILRNLGAEAQTASGKAYEFVSWSDGGAASHAIATPDSARTFTATFMEAPPNTAPTGTITAPAEGALYRGGDQLAYSATGMDPEDGALPDSAFTWRVDFHKEANPPVVKASASGSRSGTFPVPSVGETSADVFYRIHLTVRDRKGLTHASYRDVQPLKVQVTLASQPSGLRLQLDSVTVTTPHVFTGVAGIRRTLNAIIGQYLDGLRYEFVSWSDSGEASHAVILPSQDGAFTATYKDGVPGTGIRRNP